MENQELIHFIRDLLLIITGIIVSISSILILYLMLRMYKTIGALSRTINRLDSLTNKVIDEVTFPLLKISSSVQRVRQLINKLKKTPTKAKEK